MTRDELANALRSAFTPSGGWNFAEIAKYTEDFWRAWIEARLRGQDPWVPYARDEYPDAAAGIFVRFADAARRGRINTEPCQKGAGQLLASLSWDPSAGEPPHLLNNALYLAGRLRVRTPEAVTTLRDLIVGERLLARTDWPLELHRSALYALAAAQKRGNAQDEPIWRKWLKPHERAGKGHQYEFIPAAFSGLAMSRRSVPAAELLGLLDLYKQARDSEHPMTLTPAILALWVDRESDSDTVREELWYAIQESPTPEEDWGIIQLCADRAWPEIGTYAGFR